MTTTRLLVNVTAINLALYVLTGWAATAILALLAVAVLMIVTEESDAPVD